MTLDTLVRRMLAGGSQLEDMASAGKLPNIRISTYGATFVCTSRAHKQNKRQEKHVQQATTPDLGKDKLSKHPDPPPMKSEHNNTHNTLPALPPAQARTTRCHQPFLA